MSENNYDLLPESVQVIINRWIGRKVLITGDHPHADRVGRVTRFDQVATGSFGFVVECDDNSNQAKSFFVFNQKHMRVIAETERKKI